MKKTFFFFTIYEGLSRKKFALVVSILLEFLTNIPVICSIHEYTWTNGCSSFAIHLGKRLIFSPIKDLSSVFVFILPQPKAELYFYCCVFKSFSHVCLSPLLIFPGCSVLFINTCFTTARISGISILGIWRYPSSELLNCTCTLQVQILMNNTTIHLEDHSETPGYSTWDAHLLNIC